MLYFKKEISQTAVLGIWKTDETMDELMSLSADNTDLPSICALKSQSRIIEKLATWLLLTELAGEQKQIQYLASGKPYLADNSFHLSISHTKGYVAILLDKQNRVGVDIEQVSNRIKKVSSRIVSQHEYISPLHEQEHLLLHWSAKETLFKVLDENGVDFIEHLYIKPFTPGKEGYFEAEEMRTSKRQRFIIHYLSTPDFVLTYTICNNENPDCA